MTNQTTPGARRRRRVQMQRLGIEPLATAEAAALATGDLSVLAGLGDPPGLSRASDWPHADSLLPLALAVERNDDAGFAGWLAVTDGQVVGECGCTGPPGPDGTEIWFGLAPSARGQGLGTELARALTAWLLTQPGMGTIRAEVAAGNAASEAALRRAGFTRAPGSGQPWLLRPTWTSLIIAEQAE